ncbi:MAG: alpha/beta hydrolase [Acidobacteria bacterium]|nr:alpha/beta hydrolase [Acidobacteriota bacterium]
MHAIQHRDIHTNGIRMHIAEAGSGPLVILCHGFPESWYAWRHQLAALAEAGFHAVAPDMRGYGQTEQPAAVEAYDIFQLTGDIAGLAHALHADRAAIAGHDWGAVVAAHCALFRADLFHSLALVSVPYQPRRAVNQTTWEQQTYPGKVFYQAIFRSPQSEPYFMSDIRGRLLAGLYTLSGDAAPDDRWNPVIDPASPPRHVTPKMPPWLSEDDLSYLTTEYTHAGFTGGLNYYRNMDRNWTLTPFLDRAKIVQPSLFIAGGRDPVLTFLPEAYRDLAINIPNLKANILIPDAGHWTQQERPAEVNHHLVSFLQSQL